MTSWNLNVCKKCWLKLCVNVSSAFKVNKQHLRTFQHLMGTHLHLFPELGAGNTHYWAWEWCATWCSCCRAWMLPSNCLSGWRESQVNIFYHTSGHKDSPCPCFATILSLSALKKRLAKQGESVVMDKKKVGAYGGWKAYTKQLVQNPWELKVEYHVAPIGNGPTCTSNFGSNTAT